MLKLPFEVDILSVKSGLILCEYHNVILIDKTNGKNKVIQPKNAQQYYDMPLTEIYGEGNKTVLCFDKNSQGTNNIQELLTQPEKTDIIDCLNNPCEDGCIDKIFALYNRLIVLMYEEEKMTDMRNKVELCGATFPKEKVWEAYCNVCEANTDFLFPYKDVEDLIEE